MFADHACGSRGTPGREATYVLEAGVTGAVTVRLVPHGADVDLIALGADTVGECNPGACKAASQRDGTATESIELTANQGDCLYFVVDGAGGDAGVPFDLSVVCEKRWDVTAYGLAEGVEATLEAREEEDGGLRDPRPRRGRASASRVGPRTPSW